MTITATNDFILLQGEVSLLTRNIVIRGSGEGESTSYKLWNSGMPSKSPTGQTCGNGACEDPEDAKTCPADCIGPVDE